jgi:hypothetical protein
VSIGSDLVRVFLDFTLVAGLETESVRGGIAFVFVGGDCGLLVLLVGLLDILMSRSRRMHFGRSLGQSQEAHLARCSAGRGEVMGDGRDLIR